LKTIFNHQKMMRNTESCPDAKKR